MQATDAAMHAARASGVRGAADHEPKRLPVRQSAPKALFEDLGGGGGREACSRAEGSPFVEDRVGGTGCSKHLTWSKGHCSADLGQLPSTLQTGEEIPGVRACSART